jgi:hypothetical protein
MKDIELNVRIGLSQESHGTKVRPDLKGIPQLIGQAREPSSFELRELLKTDETESVEHELTDCSNSLLAIDDRIPSKIILGEIHRRDRDVEEK